MIHRGDTEGTEKKPIKSLFWVIVSLAILVIPGFGQQAGNCTAKDSSTRPDCPGAVAFFEKLQTAVKANKRAEVAAMIRYPIKIFVHGKPMELPNQETLLSHYDLAFNSSMLCAIGKASATQVWGNYQGFTFDSGEVWWDGIIPPGESPDISANDYWKKYPFKIITLNNEGALMNGCPDNWPEETKTPKQP